MTDGAAFSCLRISGQFHLVVGMLHLFGFHLPETHHRYYLASSFTDYWRRINIYWKDFMLKIFYYPAYFQLRRWGNTSALVGSTLIVFVATWFLHAYQWFWLRGSFLLAWQDVLFWVILATLVVVNSLYEARNPRERSFRKAPRTFRSSVGLVLQTSGTFIVICILWSLWTSESIVDWLLLWTAIGDFNNMDGVLYTLLMLLLLLGLFSDAAPGNLLEKIQRVIGLQKSAIVTPMLLFSLSLIGTPAVYTQLGPKAATTIYPLQTSGLNWMEVDRLERGYYEELLTVDRFNTQLWEVYMNRPLDWLDVKGGGLARPTSDFLQRELIPSSTAYAYRVTIHTNKWGMRDQEYEKLPPPNTYRIAMLGASPVMGIGVEDNETFESLLENRLNRENLVSPYAKYEVLNFAAVAYKPLQQLMVLEKALAFTPNAVFYVATHNDAGRAADYLLEVVRNKVDIPYGYLQEVVRRAEIDAETSGPMAHKRMRPFADEILSWLYLQIVENCRSRGVVPVWIYLPMPGQNWPQEKINAQIRRAEESGFVVLDLRDLYENRDIDAFRLAEWDAHPNAAAHQLIASRLYTVLQEKKASIFPHLNEQAKQP